MMNEKGGRVQWQLCPPTQTTANKGTVMIKIYKVSEEGYIKDDQQSKISSGQKEWVEK